MHVEQQLAPDVPSPASGAVVSGHRRHAAPRTWVFLCVAVLAFMILNILVALLEPLFMSIDRYDLQYTPARLVDYYQQPRPDIIFMGSSRAGWGFDPTAAESEIKHLTGTKVRALNLGMSASKISMNYLVLKNIIQDNRKPRVIVYGLSELEMSSASPNTAWSIPYFSLLLRPDDFALYAGTSVGDRVSFLAKTLLPLYRDHELIRNALSIAFNPDDPSHKFYAPGPAHIHLLRDGYAIVPTLMAHAPPNSDQIEVNIFSVALSQIHFGGDSAARLRDFLRLAQNRGIKVILVTVPVSKRMIGLWGSKDQIQEYEHVVRSTAAAYHVSLMDMYTNPHGVVPQNDFFDVQHLNKAGADVLTHLLVRRYLAPIFHKG